MVEVPTIPALDLTFRIYAYWRRDGWTSTSVDYVDDCDVAPCGSRVHLYVPSSRLGALPPGAQRKWDKRPQIEPVYKAIDGYVDEVANILSFAASKAGPKAKDALERFPVRIWTVADGTVRRLGLAVGKRVVALGPPPRRLRYYRGKRGWAIPREIYGEVFTMAWTYYWKTAIERVAKCRVEPVGGGDANVLCRGEALYVRQVLPLI